MLPPPPTPNPTTAALYKTNLPTMMPTKKKRMMRAAERALRPSSFFRPAEECWEDMTLLFLIRRPSSSWGEEGGGWWMKWSYSRGHEMADVEKIRGSFRHLRVFPANKLWRWPPAPNFGPPRARTLLMSWNYIQAIVTGQHFIGNSWKPLQTPSKKSYEWKIFIPTANVSDNFSCIKPNFF